MVKIWVLSLCLNRCRQIYHDSYRWYHSGTMLTILVKMSMCDFNVALVVLYMLPISCVDTVMLCTHCVPLCPYVQWTEWYLFESDWQILQIIYRLVLRLWFILSGLYCVRRPSSCQQDWWSHMEGQRKCCYNNRKKHVSWKMNDSLQLDKTLNESSKSYVNAGS